MRSRRKRTREGARPARRGRAGAASLRAGRALARQARAVLALPLRARAVLALAGLTLAACSGTREASNPFETGSGARSIQINVENNNFNDATIRAVSRSERRLGVVSGNSRESFTLPWPTVDDLRIRIDILAGDRFTTNRVSVGPGDRVFLTIQNPVYRSLLRR